MYDGIITLKELKRMVALCEKYDVKDIKIEVLIDNYDELDQISFEVWKANERGIKQLKEIALTLS